MTLESLQLERHGGVAVVALNEPQARNALSDIMVAELALVFDQLEADPSVRAVVLTGRGTAFCAGARLATLRSAADGDFDSVTRVYGGFLRVFRSPIPTIAAVNGPAVGAGLNLALACDVRLADENARFDARFAALHLHPSGGHAWLLARAVGQQQATMACLFSAQWDAAQALDVGLVAGVHPADELLSNAIDLGRRLDNHGPEFVRRLTATLRRAPLISDHAQALAEETADQQWSTTKPEFLAGLAAIEERIARRS